MQQTRPMLPFQILLSALAALVQSVYKKNTNTDTSGAAEEYGSWQKASKAELAAKNEALRIAALYEHTT